MFDLFNHPLGYLIIGQNHRLVQPAQAKGGDRCFLVFLPANGAPLPGNYQVFLYRLFFRHFYYHPLALNFFHRETP